MGVGRWGAVLVLLLAMGGCESIAHRIAENQAYFDNLDAQTQASLRLGEVKLGFSPKMAEIALGAPSEVRRVIRAEGERTVWLYQYHHPIYEGHRFIGFRYYSVGEGRAQRTVRVPQYRGQYRYETREYLRIEFENDALVAIERVE